jgi:hypothetical protein
MSFSKWLLQAAIICMSLPAMAATHYVWCGATGKATGVDFTNASTDLPPTLTRGDTYVVAGSGSCTYGIYTFDDAESGSTTITIRKASAKLDSAVAGYQPSFASAQAVWTTSSDFGHVWTVSTNSGYLNIDGNPDADTGEASTNCGTSCGFAIRTSHWTTMLQLGVGSSGDCTHVTVRHVEFDNTGAVLGTASGDGKVTDAINGSVCDISNFTIDHSYAHDIAGQPFDFNIASGVTAQYNYIARNQSNSAHHSTGLGCSGTNITVAYNIFVDIQGSDFMEWHNPGSPAAKGNVYGNIFWQQNPSTTIAVGDGIVACINSVVCNVNVFNNTIYNVTFGASNVYFGGAGSGSSVNVYNNQWLNSRGVNTVGAAGVTVTSDYNAYESITDSSAPIEPNSIIGKTNYFRNAAGGDFHLASETPSGNNTHALLAANDNDPDGISRATADSGIWSRGAYQDPTSNAPSPPTGLSVTVR